MSQTWKELGVQSAFVYTREAHPAEHMPHHETLEQKRAAASRFVERWSIRRPVWVDDLEGTTHRAYGALPNMAWVITPRGRVFYKAAWTNADSIDAAVRRLLWEEEQRALGHNLVPFSVEMAPSRIQDRPAFMAGLLEAGPRAVEEFIAAIRTAHGAGAVREMESWWATHRPLDDHDPPASK